MKLTPYKELLKMGEKTIKDALAGPRANKAKKKAELEMATLQERLASAQADLQEVCSAEDIDFARVTEQLDDIAITQRKIGQYETIIEQMFPEEK